MGSARQPKAGKISRSDRDVAVTLYWRMADRDSWTLLEAMEATGATAAEVTAGIDRLALLGLVDCTGGPTETERFVLVQSQVASLRLLSHAITQLDGGISRLRRIEQDLGDILGNYMTVNNRGRHEAEVQVEVIRDLTGVAEYLDTASELAKDSILTMHPAPAMEQRRLREGLQRSQDLLRRGLVLRTISQRSIATVPYVAEHLSQVRLLGYDIRISPIVPVRMIIFDRRRAVIPVDPGNGAAGAMVIEGEVMVRALVAIFDYCWQHSHYEADASAAVGLELGAQERAVLRMLATGATDETVARNLNVSLRTANRIVCRIMKDIGAGSRFQAGAVAAKLGLLH